jgi:hypothetical protein
MELIINRIKFESTFNGFLIIASSDSNELTFSIKCLFFKNRFSDQLEIVKWAKSQSINDESYISYEFTRYEDSSKLTLPLISSFQKTCSCFLVGKGLIDQGFVVEFNPVGLSLSGYKKFSKYDDNWDLYERIDFKVFYYSSKNKNLFQTTFNIGSQRTLVSRKEIDILDEYQNVKIVSDLGRIIRSKYSKATKGRLIANREIRDKLEISFDRKDINYSKRYKELLNFFNEHLKSKKFQGLKFRSSGFDSLNAQKVSFNRNKMVFKNDNTDINPITGMRNYGVYRAAPNASETKFIFIFENNDDANTLYKYLKNGYKGFPGLERYVDIPFVLADANTEGLQYKRLQYNSIDKLMIQYEAFEVNELPKENYDNHFALVIGEFDKNDPNQVYYSLKLALLAKGIPSQFINQKNIRKASVFNYHLPNIAIGIHAKLGGVPWRIDSQKKNELVIGFNQDFNKDKKRFLAGSVFFDNHGNLKRTFSFPDRESSIEIIEELRNAVNSFLEEHGEIERIVIHYHKTLSRSEKKSIDLLLKEEFEISIPYAVLEINDTKSRLDLAFDPNFNFKMPLSGSFVRLSRRDYLLFNNNRFKRVAPVGVKEELPLKIKIHFADESGFSHRELIEQVYEFSRLIWKGLKQRSQPATCFYAREIARFKAYANRPIPENRITQTTPWII